MNDRLKTHDSAKVLIIVESESSVRFLLHILNSFRLHSVDSQTDTGVDLATTKFNYDLAFVDLKPSKYQENCQFVQDFREQKSGHKSDEYLPVIGLLPNDIDAECLSEIKSTALTSGITDLISGFDDVISVDVIDMSLRISTLLEARALYKSSKALNQYLEDLVVDRTDALIVANADLANLNQQIDRSNDEIFERLARAAEFRDDTTGKHTERVGNLAAQIAFRMGMPEHFVQLISKAARLHDLGKIGIPDKILLKPSRFTPEERELMMQHCEIGAELLSGSDSPLLNMAQRIAISHHEKWNGEGYPNKLVAENIPLEGRIVAVADVYDALSHDRPYKEAWTQEKVLQLLDSKRGIHFDPTVIDVLFDIVGPDNTSTLSMAA